MVEKLLNRINDRIYDGCVKKLGKGSESYHDFVNICTLKVSLKICY